MISQHISEEEATVSPTSLRLGIDNTPTPEILEAMKLVATKCFEPLREWYGKPIKINSFYRCPALNKAVGGKDNPISQHTKGQAIDLSGGSKEENKKIYDWCKDHLNFDQLIWEYDGAWVHISYKSVGNRKMVFNIN